MIDLKKPLQKLHLGKWIDCKLIDSGKDWFMIKDCVLKFDLEGKISVTNFTESWSDINLPQIVRNKYE